MRRAKQRMGMFLCAILMTACLGFSGEAAAQKIRGARTYYSKSWNRWNIQTSKGKASLRTYYSKSWNRWTLRYHGKKMSIRTYYSKSWNRWNMRWRGGSASLKTYYSKSWNRWELRVRFKRGNRTIRKKLTIRTYYSKSWNRWNITGSGRASARTYYSKSWNRWNINDKLRGLPIMAKFAAIFPCILYRSTISKHAR